MSKPYRKEDKNILIFLKEKFLHESGVERVVLVRKAIGRRFILRESEYFIDGCRGKQISII